MISGGSLVRKDVPIYKSGKEPLSYVGINPFRRRGFTMRKN
jgi:hypothetical protein